MAWGVSGKGLCCSRWVPAHHLEDGAREAWESLEELWGQGRALLEAAPGGQWRQQALETPPRRAQRSEKGSGRRNLKQIMKSYYLELILSWVTVSIRHLTL